MNIKYQDFRKIDIRVGTVLSLKDNVKTISNPLDKVMALRGVEFDWNKGNEVVVRRSGNIKLL